MKYCILVVKIVEDYIISGFLPNIDIPCALTIRSYFLQSKVVLFFLVVFSFLFCLLFLIIFLFLFIYLFFLGEGGSNGYMNAVFFIQTYYNLLSLN